MKSSKNNQENGHQRKLFLKQTLEAVKAQLVKCIKKGQIQEAESLKQQLGELTLDLTEKQPICRRLKTNDATVEKLSHLLQENPNGILVLRDELAGWLSSLNKYGRDGDREFYLESWNGYGSYTVDRIGRGTINVPSLCLSVFGGIQPDKLNRLLTNGLNGNDDGLLQRFQLLVYPELKGKWKNVDRRPNLMAMEKVHQLLKGIYKRDFIFKENAKGIHFDLESQEVFNNWRSVLEDMLRSGAIDNPHFESHLAKYRSLLPSLALIFQLIKENSDSVDENTTIDVESTNLALKWCEFLKEHAKKVYQINNYKHFHSVQTLAKKITSGKIKDGDNVREIYRNGWQHLKTPDTIESAIEFLSDLNWVRIDEIKTGHRPARVIKLNPGIQQ